MVGFAVCGSSVPADIDETCADANPMLVITQCSPISPLFKFAGRQACLVV